TNTYPAIINAVAQLADAKSTAWQETRTSTLFVFQQTWSKIFQILLWSSVTSALRALVCSDNENTALCKFDG
ncbi:hypothetical protein, partial [Pseudoalteromonas sp. S1609]|uniref:hypothetical protein n=1 Tax=Pseudoalteromonas sp. S1609 TaxID=579505 RepID=UPI001BB2811A